MRRTGKLFNGGMLVLRPSARQYSSLLAAAEAEVKHHVARRFAEQGFLNTRFTNWAEVGPEWNMPFQFTHGWPQHRNQVRGRHRHVWFG